MERQDALNHRDLESLKEGKVVAIIPVGISMLPFIKGGACRVYLLKKDKVEVGDIVLADYQGRHLLHRVYAIDGERITLMGDGNLEGTEVVKATDILGTAVEMVGPDGRHRQPKKAWLWRKLLPIRRYLLKIHRKWDKFHQL